jgi:hypothetical protein
MVLAITFVLGLAVATPGRAELIDAWNDDQVNAGAIVPAGSTYYYRWAYTPDVDYVLERIEFFTSAVAPPGVAVVSVDGATESIELTYGVAWIGDEEWQGIDFPDPPELVAGQEYYLILELQEVSVIPYAIAGDAIPFWFKESSSDEWMLDENGQPWMVRFFGSTEVAAETTTWSDVKLLYQ